MERAISILAGAATFFVLCASLAASFGGWSIPSVPTESFLPKVVFFLVLVTLAGYLLGLANRKISTHTTWPVDIALMVGASLAFAWLVTFAIHWILMDRVIPASSEAHNDFVNFCLLASLIGVGVTLSLIYKSSSWRFMLSFLGLFVMGHMIVAVLYFEGALF